MTDELIKEFLTGFDESCFPENFLEDYEILECLSQNEIGETFLVKNRQSGDLCVSKCYSDWSFFSQTNESELLKKVSRKGLPVFIAEYRNDDMLCVIRSWAKGKPLHKLAREKRLTTRQCFSVAIQLCEILDYLHQQIPPIIHRDIKPQNIILDDEGQVTLIDFGISRVYDETARKDTFCFGTSNYAAPEQYGFSQTNNRSDIFSFGVFLCWLFTGIVDVQSAIKTINDRQMGEIITKCTAFDPDKRYKSMKQVKNALSVNMPVPRKKVLQAYALLVLVAVIIVISQFNFKTPVSGVVRFKEPLIEQAVHLALDKDLSEELTEKDLLLVNEIFVFGDNAAADTESFNTFAENFANNGGGIQRGNISDLEDLSKLKNLRNISLVYQNITDLSPLSSLPSLENLDLRHNPIEDVSPLSQISSLSTLSLFGSNVSDLSVLQPCFRLTVVDVGDSAVHSIAAFDGLDSLRVLGLKKTALQSLEQIEKHFQLEEIYLSDTLLTDLSPLLELPNLKIVEVDESMRTAAEQILSQIKFSLIYQE